MAPRRIDRRGAPRRPRRLGEPGHVPPPLAAAASLVVAGRGAVTGCAAASLARLDGIDEPAEVEVLVGNGARMPGDVPWLVVRRSRAELPPQDVVELDGIVCTGIARTICELAGRIDAPLLERVLDDVERRGYSLRWIEQTARRLQSTGRRGPHSVLADLERRRRRSAGQVRGSWFQRLLRDCLRSPILVGLVEEHEVRDGSGRLVARVDLAVPSVRLAIEAHSKRYHFGVEAEAADEDRDARLGEVGWDVRYVGYARLTSSPEDVRRSIERQVLRRAGDLGVGGLQVPAGRSG